MTTQVTGPLVSWRPAVDDQLAWFKLSGASSGAGSGIDSEGDASHGRPMSGASSGAGSGIDSEGDASHGRPMSGASSGAGSGVDTLPTHPKPLEFTCAIHAFAYGFTRALESLYFPFYEIRPRLINGELYCGVVPSGLADRDIEARIAHITERTIRFRDILAVWKRDVQPEVQELLHHMAGFPPAGVTGEELREAWFRLRRVRALQWFAPIRAVICPAALLRVGIGEAPAAEAQEAVEGVRAAVIRQGTEVFNAAVERLGHTLVRSGSLDAPDDLLWLEFDEVSAAIESPGTYQETATKRRSPAAAAGQHQGPFHVGAPLDLNDRRLFLLPEVFDLLGINSPLSPEAQLG